MDIIKIYHDKKWTLQFSDALYNSIDFSNCSITSPKYMSMASFSENYDLFMVTLKKINADN
jgi:hypothetical protein